MVAKCAPGALHAAILDAQSGIALAAKIKWLTLLNMKFSNMHNSSTHLLWLAVIRICFNIWTSSWSGVLYVNIWVLKPFTFDTRRNYVVLIQKAKPVFSFDARNHYPALTRGRSHCSVLVRRAIHGSGMRCGLGNLFVISEMNSAIIFFSLI